MNFPTSLTLLRIFFVPLLVVLLLTKQPNMDLWAVAILLVAAFTDLLDGHLARKHGRQAAHLRSFYFTGGTWPGAGLDGGDHRGA
jgi:phosphatidylglycerophosphate synthase